MDVNRLMKYLYTVSEIPSNILKIYSMKIVLFIRVYFSQLLFAAMQWGAVRSMFPTRRVAGCHKQGQQPAGGGGGQGQKRGDGRTGRGCWVWLFSIDRRSVRLDLKNGTSEKLLPTKLFYTDKKNWLAVMQRVFNFLSATTAGLLLGGWSSMQVYAQVWLTLISHWNDLMCRDVFCRVFHSLLFLMAMMH